MRGGCLGFHPRGVLAAALQRDYQLPIPDLRAADVERHVAREPCKPPPPKTGRERTITSELSRVWISSYGMATKFWVLEVAGPVVPLPEPTANWLTCQIWFAVEGSGVAAA